MFDARVKRPRSTFTRKTDPSQLPKQITVKGQFGKTSLIDCVAKTTSAAFKKGDHLMLSRTALKKHYGCRL